MFIAQVGYQFPKLRRSEMYTSPLTGLGFNLEPECYKHAAPPGLLTRPFNRLLPSAYCLLPCS
jgi:hypothetical protein